MRKEGLRVCACFQQAQCEHRFLAEELHGLLRVRLQRICSFRNHYLSSLAPATKSVSLHHNHHHSTPQFTRTTSLSTHFSRLSPQPQAVQNVSQLCLCLLVCPHVSDVYADRNCARLPVYMQERRFGSDRWLPCDSWVSCFQLRWWCVLLLLRTGRDSHASSGANVDGTWIRPQVICHGDGIRLRMSPRPRLGPPSSFH